MSVFNILTLVCAIGCGLMAGIFFAFSTSVMTALGKLPAAQGIAAMQTINVVILNPVFLSVFVGTAIACLIAIVGVFLNWNSPGILWMLGGAVLYLIGSFVVTMLFNVPRNNMLARLNPDGPEAVAVWKDYLTTWTAWNHARTVASLAAAISFALRAFLR